MMARIDRWVLQHTLQAMRGHGLGADLPRLGVNLSGQSLGDARFQAWALQELAACGDSVCSRLTVEVTETMAIQHLGEAARFFAELRSLGIRIAIDDFGAGASSFVYLKRLPVDYLKIDGQFVRGLLHDPVDAAAVASFVQFASAVGIKTVAEFVDCPRTLERLREMGVGFAQGFLLHRPEPLASVVQRWPLGVPDAAGDATEPLAPIANLATLQVAAS
jgi:EAL domain-containing protein (putative c-di-GMP-specific phosphodiesterase class I)